MKEIRKTEVIENVVTKWVADDGREFDNQIDCAVYERKCEAEKKLESIEYCEELDGMCNFAGGEYPDEDYYHWYRPKNLDEVKVLNDAYNLSISEAEMVFLVNEWICIEEYRYDDYVWYSTLKMGIKYVTSVLNTLGYDVQITKRNEN